MVNYELIMCVLHDLLVIEFYWKSILITNEGVDTCLKAKKVIWYNYSF